MKLTKNTLDAIKDYYFNRSRQDVVKWNKDKDLEKIIKSLKEDDRFVSFSGSCGTFWVTLTNKANRYDCVKINEKNFPSGERVDSYLRVFEDDWFSILKGKQDNKVVFWVFSKKYKRVIADKLPSLAAAKAFISKT